MHILGGWTSINRRHDIFMRLHVPESMARTWGSPNEDEKDTFFGAAQKVDRLAFRELAFRENVLYIHTYIHTCIHSTSYYIQYPITLHPLMMFLTDDVAQMDAIRSLRSSIASRSQTRREKVGVIIIFVVSSFHWIARNRQKKSMLSGNWKLKTSARRNRRNPV